MPFYVASSVNKCGHFLPLLALARLLHYRNTFPQSFVRHKLRPFRLNTFQLLLHLLLIVRTPLPFLQESEIGRLIYVLPALNLNKFALGRTYDSQRKSHGIVVYLPLPRCVEFALKYLQIHIRFRSMVILLSLLLVGFNPLVHIFGQWRHNGNLFFRHWMNKRERVTMQGLTV